MKWLLPATGSCGRAATLSHNLDCRKKLSGHADRVIKKNELTKYLFVFLLKDFHCAPWSESALLLRKSIHVGIQKSTRQALVLFSTQTHPFSWGEFWAADLVVCVAAIPSETHRDSVLFLLRSSLPIIMPLLRLFSFEQWPEVWGCCGPRERAFEAWWSEVVAKQKINR